MHADGAGVLMCVHLDAAAERAPLLDEAPVAAAQLRRVMRPAYPLLLLANHHALAALNGSAVRTAFDRARELKLDDRIRSLDHGTWRGARAARPYLMKLSCLLQSDFNRTLFIDCDTFVLRPSLVHHMLNDVLTVSDIAMPLDPGRERHLSVRSSDALPILMPDEQACMWLCSLSMVESWPQLSKKLSSIHRAGGKSSVGVNFVQRPSAFLLCTACLPQVA